MSLTGEIEVAFVDPEIGSSLDWSALNLVVYSLANHGFKSPVELEDVHGNIKPQLSPDSLSDLTEHLAAHGEEIAREADSQPWRERGKTFASSRETVTFVMSAVRMFRDCVRHKRSLIVAEMPAHEIDIIPGLLE